MLIQILNIFEDPFSDHHRLTTTVGREPQLVTAVDVLAKKHAEVAEKQNTKETYLEDGDCS